MSERYYNGSGQRLATEAFVSGSYATKSYVDTKATSFTEVANKSYGEKGYVRYRDGFTIQWGYGKASQTSYFPIAFKKKIFSIVGSQRNWEPADYPIGFKDVTLTSFKGTNRWCDDPFWYIAIGI